MSTPDKQIPAARKAKVLAQDSLFRAAFESSRTVMFLIDPGTGHIISANPAACEFYGYDPEDWASFRPRR